MNIRMQHPQTIRRLFVGPYDELYASRPDNILWGDKPSRLVSQFLKTSSTGGIALDIGCGDGANALALEISGFKVLGVDISSLALRGLQNRFVRAGHQPKGRYLTEDVSKIAAGSMSMRFDCIVSCGLFQCLDLRTRVETQRTLFQHLLAPKGVILFSCLTNAIPLPVNHRTSGLELVARDEIERLFVGWELVQYEEGIIDDSHVPIVSAHRHSVVWAIAKRNKAASL